MSHNVGIAGIAGKIKSRSIILLIGAFTTSSAMAHSGSAHAMMSFWSGFAHPFSGVDHMLAMLAVGIWAAQQKRNAPVWILPAVFLLMMALGAVFGTTGGKLPSVEFGIAASVAVLGLLIAFAVGLPMWMSAMTVSVFAMIHGYAHGVELTGGASLHLYGAGFVIATALLHLVGLCLGSVANKALAAKVLRFGGAGIAATGVCLLMV